METTVFIILFMCFVLYFSFLLIKIDIAIWEDERTNWASRQLSDHTIHTGEFYKDGFYRNLRAKDKIGEKALKILFEN